MNRSHILIAVGIAVGVLGASTLATLAYLNSRGAATTRKNLFSEPLTAVTSPSPKPIPLGQVPGSSTTSGSTTTSPATSTENNSLLASEFSQFRLRLLNALQRRDDKFIHSIVSPQTDGFKGNKLNLDTDKIDSSHSQFWTRMEKAVKGGCAIDSQAQIVDKDAGSSVWMCPSLTNLNQSISADSRGSKKLAILGENVNVRVDPRAASRVVGIVSHEYVTFDEDALNKPLGKQPKGVERRIIDEWTPVMLTNGQHGWVLNRYVYNEDKDYRVGFVHTRGQWQMRYLLPGNEN